MCKYTICLWRHNPLHAVHSSILQCIHVPFLGAPAYWVKKHRPPYWRFPTRNKSTFILCMTFAADSNYYLIAPGILQLPWCNLYACLFHVCISAILFHISKLMEPAPWGGHTFSHINTVETCILRWPDFNLLGFTGENWLP